MPVMMKCAVPSALLATTMLAHAQAGFPAEVELSSLNGSDGFVLPGVFAHGGLGAGISSAGDFNDDGYDDVIIGAPYAGDFDEGQSYVVFGRPSLGDGGGFDLTSLDGMNGFVIPGLATFDAAGDSVASAGDINGDGVDDVLIGAPFATEGGTRSGVTYVVFGDAGIGATGEFQLSLLDGVNGFRMRGAAQSDELGAAVSPAGDINGDGVDDLFVGAPFTFSGGASYVIFGGENVGSGGVVTLFDLDGSDGFVIEAAEPGDRAGVSLAGAGDVNADGYQDLIVGANRASRNSQRSGAAFVVFGGPDVGASGVLSLAQLDGSNGFVIPGAFDGYNCGGSVSVLGDFNGDAIDDFVVGSSTASLTGEAYVVFGDPHIGSSGVLEVFMLTGANGFLIRGEDSGDSAGSSVSGAGDVNADGFADVIIGAPRADERGSSSGASYVVFGGPDVGLTGPFSLSTLDGTNGFTINGANAGDESGDRVAFAGDVNGDGIDDLLIGARRAQPNGIGSGTAYVLFGRGSRPADLNGDGVVNALDLAILLAAWDSDGADLDGDGVTGTGDLATLLAAWG